MSEQQFRIGEYVSITIDGRVVAVGAEGHDNDITTTVQVSTYDAGGSEYFITLPSEWTSVRFEHKAPAEWPPRPGDLWRDRQGHTWFGQQYYADFDNSDDFKGCNQDGWRTVLVAVSGGPYGIGAERPEKTMQEYGPLTLVHREEAP